MVRSPFKAAPIRVRLTYLANWNATSSGVQTFLVTRDPSTTAPSWASFATKYDEFRVIGMRVRIFFPRDALVLGEVIGTAAAGYLSEVPTCCSLAYDNDTTTTFTLGTSVGYDSALTAPPVGEVMYGVKSLPVAMVRMASAAGSAITSSEWSDTLTSTNLMGGINVAINRLYGGFWGTAPATLTQIPYLVEWDVAFRARNAQ